MSEAGTKATGFYPEALNCVPRGWKILPVGQLLESSQYGLNVAADIAGDVPIVGMKDIVDGYVKTHSLAMARINSKGPASHTLSRGDILINRTNSYDLVGKVGIYDSEIPSVFASYLVRLHVKRDVIDPWFLNYWLNHSVAQQIIKRIATRAVGQANINPTEFKKYCPVPLPPLNEQHHIVEVLRTWDEAIQKMEHLILAKKTIKRQHMEQLLRPCCDDGVGHWLEVHLGELFNERVQRATDEERLLSVTASRGIINRDELEKRDTSSEDKSNYKLILPGDIGYNTMRMWQGVSGLSSLRGIVSPAYTVCIPKPDLLDGEFAAYLFKLPRMIFQFWRYSQGLVDDTLSLKFPNFSHITIHLPDTTTQHNIVTILKARDTELEKLYRLKSRYYRQKLGLIQMLLTGKWRVRLGVSDERMFNGVDE